MALRPKDVGATLVTAAAVLCFFASYQGWNVPLVGDSYRWAAAGIMVLGIAGCSLGAPAAERASRDATTIVLSTVGGVALVAGVLAIVSGSLFALEVLTAATVALWAVATVRHMLHLPHRPVAA